MGITRKSQITYSDKVRASGRSREKKSNSAGFSGPDSRKKAADFAGISRASFAEKRLIKNGRFRWKAIGCALILGN